MTDLGLHSTALNVAKTLGRQMAAGLIQLLTIVAIARICGPEGNGEYNIALLLPTLLAALLSLGIAPANVYYLGLGSVSIYTAWQATWRLWLVIVAAGFALGIMVINWFANDWFPGVPSFSLWISLLSFPAILLLNLLSSIFQGTQKFRQYNLILLLQPLLALALILAVFLSGIYDIAWLLGAYLFSFLATLFVGFRLLKPMLSDQQKIEAVGYASIAAAYGFKSHLGNILTYINYKVDLLLVNLFLGPAASGIYIIAVQLAERIWMLSQSVSTVILPRLSQLSNEEDKRRELTPIISRWVLWITVVLAGLLALISYTLISLIFGPKFIGAALPLILLLPGIILMAPARVLANDVAARGHPELNACSSFVALIINVAGNIFLIPIYGLAGAAVATSMAYSAIFLMCLLMHHHFTGLPISMNMIPCRQDVDLVRAYLGRSV